MSERVSDWFRQTPESLALLAEERVRLAESERRAETLKVLCPNECRSIIVVDLPIDSYHNACVLGRVIGDALLTHAEKCSMTEEQRERNR